MNASGHYFPGKQFLLWEGHKTIELVQAFFFVS